MKNLQEMMQQAAGLQKRMEEVQAEIAAMEAEGVAGAGLVRVTLTGKGYASRIAIDPRLFAEDEREVLEDLLAAAFNDARARLDRESQDKMKALTAGLPLPPGLKLPF